MIPASQHLCFGRGPRFSSQHTHGDPAVYNSTARGSDTPSLDLCNKACGTFTYMPKNIQLKLKKKCFLKQEGQVLSLQRLQTITELRWQMQLCNLHRTHCTGFCFASSLLKSTTFTLYVLHLARTRGWPLLEVAVLCRPACSLDSTYTGQLSNLSQQLAVCMWCVPLKRCMLKPTWSGHQISVLRTCLPLVGFWVWLGWSPAHSSSTSCAEICRLVPLCLFIKLCCPNKRKEGIISAPRNFWN